MRKPHYIKIASAQRTPSNIICFDTETHLGVGSTERNQLHTLTLGCAIFYRREKSRRTRVKELVFYDADVFWDWVKSRMSKDRATWIFAHNAGYDLGIADAWREFSTDTGWMFRRAIVERGIVLLDGEYRGCPFVFSDTLNYWKASLAEIGRSVGRVKQEMPATDIPTKELVEYCRNDTLIVADAVDNICKFIEDEGFGPFGPTAASLAYNTWRKSFMSHKVLVHTDKHALELERAGYYGGIVDTPFIGVCPASPIYELDVVSMYPSVCMEPMPTKLKGVYHEIDTRRVSNLFENYMFIARVEIQTDKAIYPYKADTGTLYPVGRFITTLADSEFRSAWAKGRISQIHRLAVYECERIFAKYMTFFLEKKTASALTDKAASTALYKLMLNSLYGKMGQTTPKWKQAGPEAEMELEKLYNLPTGSLKGVLPVTVEHPVMFWQLSVPEYNILLDMRSIFGIVEVNTTSTETRDSCPAIAACVTSAARTKLRGYQDVVGPRNYYYTDTDSIWVNMDGYIRLVDSGLVGSAAGMLSLKGKCRQLTVYGRKDYHAADYQGWDGKEYGNIHQTTKRKGVKKNAIQLADAVFQQEIWPGIISQLQSPYRGVVAVQRGEKTLHRSITHCHVGNDGWTSPFQFEDLSNG